MKRSSIFLSTAMIVVSVIAAALVPASAAGAGSRSALVTVADNPNPPDHVVKLIFIHHSTGENWLRDDYGGLGEALAANNYFVSDTNYGWGPDSIGDRTDIPNWTEWFASDQTPVYMNALANESGQNSSYTRTAADPGGENEIILFKSCFPNSALEGNPNDLPSADGWLTVGHAKYVYNDILKYFASRPDKLFVVITAPPLIDGTYADNARAFNNWLMNDWLAENNYTLKNVAVFDFYNVLTAKNAHHWYNNGQIEHIVTDRNTEYYPSGDDHPSEKGSKKATDEFLPLLNIFYHRWVDSGTANLPPAQNPTTSAPTESPVNLPPSTSVGVIDNFEDGAPAETGGWEGYFQDNTNTKLTCAPESGNAHNGAASLKFDFKVDANSWATCGFYFDATQNWSAGQGISFYIRADRAGIPFDVNLYGGNPGGRTTYAFHSQTPAGGENGWVLVEIPWENILRVEWEENAGTPFNPSEVTGFSIGLSSPEKERLTGTIWLDDLSLIGTAPVTPPTVEASTSEPEEPESNGSGLPCLGGAILPLLLVGASWMLRRK
jgi:hypothetical protein